MSPHHGAASTRLNYFPIDQDLVAALGKEDNPVLGEEVDVYGRMQASSPAYVP